MLRQVVSLPPHDNEESFVIRMALTMARADVGLPTADQMIDCLRQSITHSPEFLEEMHEQLRKERKERKERNLGDAELPTADQLAESKRKEIEEKVIPRFNELYGKKNTDKGPG
jgi:hypothetical protein